MIKEARFVDKKTLFSRRVTDDVYVFLGNATTTTACRQVCPPARRQLSPRNLWGRENNLKNKLVNNASDPKLKTHGMPLKPFLGHVAENEKKGKESKEEEVWNPF